MQHHKIWMRFLALGVFSLILFGFSCKKRIEYAQMGYFTYFNQTPYTIKLDYTSFSFIIEPNKSYTFSQNQDAIENVSADTFNEPLSRLVNRTTPELTFKIGDKCFKSTSTSMHSVLNLKNYIAEQIGSRTYKFTYTFTDEDYNRAVTCP